MGLAAILGVARVAGNEGGHVEAGAAAAWEPVGERTALPTPAEGAPAGMSTAEPGAASELSASAESRASAPSAPVTEPTSGDVLLAEPPDWWAVLAELDRRRAAALAALDLDSVSEHALPGSPAWDADAALLADLQERGLHPRGLTSPVLAVEQVERQGVQAQMQIVDQRSAYSLVDARGEVVDRVEAAPRAMWSVTLQQREANQGWRIVEVIPTSWPDVAGPPEGEEVP